MRGCRDGGDVASQLSEALRQVDLGKTRLADVQRKADDAARCALQLIVLTAVVDTSHAVSCTKHAQVSCIRMVVMCDMYVW